METNTSINRWLKDTYGRFEDGRANWRISWSDDEREIRHGTFVKYSQEGIYLGEETGYKEVPKYPYIKSKFILERLIPIPFGVETDLITKTSYETVWTFEDKDGFPLPYKREICQIVIDSIYRASARAVGAKYKDPDSVPEEMKENELKRVIKLQEELFGDETQLTDALHAREAVSVNGFKQPN